MNGRLLIASYSAPQHDRDSGSRRILDHIDMLLDAGWDITFVGTNHRGDDGYVRDLERRGVPVRAGDDPQLPVLIERGGFDVALLAFWPVAELLLPLIRRLSPRTKVVVDSVDLHYLRLARRRLGRGSGDGQLLETTFGEEMVAELNTYAAADVVITVSQKEAETLGDMLGGSVPVLAVPDVEDLDASVVPFAEREGVQFVGSFRHEPNVQAVSWLCREVWSQVEERLTHPLLVVGDGMDETIREVVEGAPDTTAVGWVPSVVPYLARARVSVIPLRYGAGTKRKLIQALMLGTPTVSTSVGTEGLDLVDGEHVLVADGARDFAAAIDRLLRDEDLWSRLSDAGRRHVLRRHGRPRAAAALSEAVEAALACWPTGRRLPETGRERYHERLVSQDRARRNGRVHDLVRETVPAGAVALVASKGDPDLVQLDGREGRHFPRDPGGGYAGHYPEDGAAAVAHLEAQRGLGGEFLVLPDWSRWWLDHYVELRCHLEANARLVADRPGDGMVWTLDGAAAVASSRVVTEPQPLRLQVAGPDADSPDEPAARLIAFVLPQFHPIAENDQWWGPGFTEWTNVTRATPLFPDHYQPHLPSDLGFYDLRLAETRAAQAELAAAHGIEAFCWYHYWFGGRRLLERPFDEVLASGEPDFPFVLCWANEPWSRRWDGSSASVLQPQVYSDEDDVAHIRALLPALADRRAVTVDGRPMFLVYRADQLPDARRTTDTWRREVARAGLPGLHLVAVETGWDEGWDATEVGFDAKVLFQPQFSMLRRSVPELLHGGEGPQVHRYDDAWPVLSEPDPVPYRRYDTVAPGWDNTARTGRRGVVLHGATPEAYEEWLRKVVMRVQQEPPEHRLVFLNAWNEWAEGCHLEPDARHGRAFLEATRRAVHVRLPSPAPA